MKQTNSMQLLYGFDNIPPIDHAVITVGSYDGVHSGHKVIIDKVVERAKCCGGSSVVLTFEPHPRITLGRDEGLKLLTSLDEKALLLEQLNVDYLLVIPFDRAFSQISHEEFVNNYLIKRLNAKEIVIGYNHHFGHNKSGDYNYLTDTQPHLTVTQVEQQLVESNKVSSTVIRAALSLGDITTTNRLLGHRYIIIGTSDNDGFVATDRYKLLPPAADYQAAVNGNIERITVCENGVYTSVKATKVTIEL